MDNLEKAALPSVDEEERKRLLSFVVCGGGPTGVEFASELWEMVTEDINSCKSTFLSVYCNLSLTQDFPNRHASLPSRRDQGSHHSIEGSHSQHLC